MEDNTSIYYFFSTLAQCLAAIYGLLGVYVVFRIEQIKRHISDGCEKFKAFLRIHANGIIRQQVRFPEYDVDVRFDAWLEKDVFPHLLYYLERDKIVNENGFLLAALSDYYENNRRATLHVELLKWFFLRLIIAVSLLIASALIALLIYGGRFDACLGGFLLFVIVFLVVVVIFSVKCVSDVKIVNRNNPIVNKGLNEAELIKKWDERILES